MANELMMRRPYIDAYAAIQEGKSRVAEEQKAQEAARFEQARRIAANNALREGRIDPTAYSNELARMGFAHLIPGEQEALYKIEEQVGKSQEALGKGAQEGLKALSDRFQYWRDLVPTDPNRAANWVRAVYKDPIVGPELAKFGTAEEVISEIPSDPTKYMGWVGSVSDIAKNVAAKLVPTAEAMLPYTQPMTPEVFRQQRALRESGAPRLPPSESAYQTTVAKAAGEEDIASFTAAQRAADDLIKDFETINLLQTGKASTGVTAELALGINRLKADVGGNKEAARKVADTELLNALLGSNVFSNIQALGIGARGLDTPAEREFLREVVSGTITLNAETLRRMAEIRANVKERAIDRFNQRVEKGELDSYFKATGREKRKIEKPPRPGKATDTPNGVPPELWNVMTPEERALWQKK